MGLFLKGEEVGPELTQAQSSWTFAVEEYSSRTHPGGTLLKLSRIRRRSEAMPIDGLNPS